MCKGARLGFADVKKPFFPPPPPDVDVLDWIFVFFLSLSNSETRAVCVCPPSSPRKREADVDDVPHRRYSNRPRVSRGDCLAAVLIFEVAVSRSRCCSAIYLLVAGINSSCDLAAITYGNHGSWQWWPIAFTNGRSDPMKQEAPSSTSA